MDWREADGVEWLEAELPGARAAFSTRSIDAKAEPARFARALGLAPERVAVAEQVHGAELIFHGAEPSPPAPADGHVLRSPGVAAMVYVADCLPVALVGPGGAAMLHCGWRGVAAGIVERGAAAVEAEAAAIGPGIGPCCFEVGDEVLEAFAPLGEGIARGRMLDLPEVAARLLERAGVRAIERAGLCTRCEDGRFFSHRRDGGPERQAGLLWRDGGERQWPA